MHYKTLGNTGLMVSELCLGTMTFGAGEGFWGDISGVNQEGADLLVKTAFDAGINFLDTANVYCGGQSEQILGQSLRNLGIAREETVIASKVFGIMGKGPNDRGASRGHIMTAIQASLKRIGTDYIDLYQIHGFDSHTPIEETLEALNDLVKQGYIRYIGLSNWAAWQVMKAVDISRYRGLSSIASLQAYYTIVGRDLEREIVPMLLSENVGLMVWSPLAGGFLSGKYKAHAQGEKEGRRSDFNFPPVNLTRGYPLLEVMRKVAEKQDCSVAEIALAWLLHQKVVTSIIIGAKRLDQLQDNIGSTKIVLDEESLEMLDKASQLDAEYPGWMLERQGQYRQFD
ncbi:MAG: aldo/keto reductase [Zymomonas mobilis subsp. pomaceae]|uniref:Aldo/keto reductase n=1 Tax=Zymomonas mobilis subsp. pomaceae (strain ATCC 29192 / DSM 22645 / JCM 10191 / CCUG 17912 / NBRC 13757 / NCIMB 11200 / NRRL B-4491 / Barker I) TaxID=579138 RepID=F8ESK6_ZYMMT|nr:aldo/keto reductase [Zymomonas mobilis]AEI37781.1 aldo/keto reductase [Zymomonas mobilis subsp. pomaceae ATCC 29192]MDX5949148.1 aldo/keto reductase [Zymomonas mobilis subsp. pomaceae]GEB89783.1 aldo/keto reductase [Zymomonas mobilis subsp. pomaceae]